MKLAEKEINTTSKYKIKLFLEDGKFTAKDSLSAYNKLVMLGIDVVIPFGDPPTEVILVIDGQITTALQDVVNEYQSRYPEILKIISLKKNVGLGNALNEGLKHCAYEFVARMDTDDLCKYNRFEKQLAIFEKNPNLAVVGSWIDEFVDTPENVISIKKLPEKNIDLMNYVKSRNPLNHPSVMFRKSIIQKVGGYQHFYLLEDYFLWVRLIVAGYELYNIQESLLLFRVSSKMIARRGGWKYAISELLFFKELYKLNFYGFGHFIKNVMIRFPIRIMPIKFRSIIYKKLLR